MPCEALMLNSPVVSLLVKPAAVLDRNAAVRVYLV